MKTTGPRPQRRFGPPLDVIKGFIGSQFAIGLLVLAVLAAAALPLQIPRVIGWIVGLVA